MESLIERRFISVFLCIFAMTIFSFGQILIPGYTPDDFLTGNSYLPAALYFSQGRFTEGVLIHALNMSHLTMFNVGFGFSLMVLLLYAFLIAYLLKLCVPGTFDIRLVGAAGLYIAASPFMATLLNYRQVEFDLAVGLSFLCLGIYFHQKYMSGDRWGIDIPVASALFCFSLGCYQVIIVIIFLYVSFLVVRRKYEGEVIGLPYLVKAYSAPFCAVVLYMVLFAATKNIAGVNNWDQRGSLLGLSGIGTRLHDIYDVTKFSFDINTIHISAKILISMYLLFLAGMAQARNRQVTVMVFLASLASYVVVLLPISVLSSWDPTPRTLLGVYFVIGFWVLWTAGTAGIFVRGTALFLGLLSVHSMMESNSFLIDQIKENRWDMNVAWSLIKDIRVFEKNQQPSSLSVVVHPSYYGRSSFRVGWSIKGLLYEAGHVEWPISDPTPDMRAQCDGSVHFPVAGYLHRQKDNGILACL
ncbi:glucosyltransferase domain-containing protein [Gluconacetobacter tumulisoli]|uniref:Glycosyltransferase RgtA/B/C/D-like domain-containing protein n=1 Tax=Gluconacetobacter tumulisoli TaxID=1286189 RepID=A0A7W4K641_9PROT|nr:glucosyltransferase domain-containing protein [Gluconacetobacter tumulisoli]MBB2201036.1 hypothetical protein [Gluconacetobacter tumulisoli]